MTGYHSPDNWENDYARRGRIWAGAMYQHIPLDDGKRVLELGCGNGKTCNALLEKKCQVVGIDFSSSAVHLCRSHMPKNAKGHFAIADVCNLPFYDASFDAVTAFHVIGHILAEGRNRCAREAARVLRPGGTLYFSDFSTYDFRAGIGVEIELQTFSRKNGIGTHYFSEDEVSALFHLLVPRELQTRYWTMKVRGQLLHRAEISASFTKKI
ncbi:MAG: class I SAM-dependent methyltransferase [Methanoregula sp.]|uniref:class I SAM-dependent methyltransferase n=1 Tax=Methanoregula sp. TaxID=2052170 RepID=UPI003BAFF5C5